MSEIDIYEAAYGAWMDAIRAVHTPSQIHKVLTSPKNSKVTDPIRSLQVQTVNQWFKRLSIPKEFRAQVMGLLEEIAKEKILETPKGAIPGVSFHDTWTQLEKQRQANSTTGKKVAKDLDDLYLDGVIGLPVTWSGALDLLNLNLGSGELGGAVPDFVTRDISDELVDSMNDQTKSTICVVGPYKSGKTRLLIEAVSKSTLKESHVFWMNPGFDGLAERFMSLSPAQLKGSIFIFDDLQRFSYFSETGLTPKLIAFLSSLGKVLVTVGEADFLQWDLTNDYDFQDKAALRSSPSIQLRNQLTQNRFHLASRLTDKEIARATNLYGENLARKDIEFLPSFMASTKQLVSRAKLFKVNGSAFDVAFLDAIIDARVLYPSGVTLKQLKWLTKRELHDSNAVWSDEDWNRALKFCTRGVVTGSPHAILQKLVEDRARFLIMDSVWQEIMPNSWNSLRLRPFPVEEVIDLAENIYSIGFENDAIEVLEEVAGSHLDRAPGLLGYYHLKKGNLPEASNWINLALEHRNQYANSLMGSLKLEEGRLEEAISHFTKSLDTDDKVSALLDLNAVAMQMNDFPLAESYARKAVALGSVEALADLGLSLLLQGKRSEAKRSLLKAANLGIGWAYLNLGTLYAGEGKRQKAIDAYLAAGDLGIQHAWNNVGMEYASLGDSTKAVSFFRKSIDAGVHTSYGNLGRTLLALGDHDEAIHTLKLGYAEGEVISIGSLGEIELNKGNLEQAKSHFLRAAIKGLSRSWLSLCFIYEQQDSKDLLEKASRKAISNGEILGFYYLAGLHIRSGHFEEARKTLVDGITMGLRPDLITKTSYSWHTSNLEFQSATMILVPAKTRQEDLSTVFGMLKSLLMSHLDSAEPRETLSQLADLGYLEARNLLGEVLFEHGDRVGALIAWNEAASHGSVEALVNLSYDALQEGDFHDAKSYARSAARKGSPLGWNNLACVYEKENKLVQAEKYFRLAAEAGLPLAAANVAHLLVQRGELDAALEFARTASEGGNTSGLLNLGVIHELKGEFQDALRIFRDLADQSVPLGIFNFGRLSLREGNRELALELLQRASALGVPEAEVLLACELVEAGNLVDAEKLFLKSIAAGHSEAKISYANMLLENGRQDEGLDLLKTAGDDGHINAYGDLAERYKAMGDSVHARKYSKLAKTVKR
jgi:tetratricopeptide (TPR) repeat protein